MSSTANLTKAPQEVLEILKTQKAYIDGWTTYRLVVEGKLDRGLAHKTYMSLRNAHMLKEVPHPDPEKAARNKKVWIHRDRQHADILDLKVVQKTEQKIAEVLGRLKKGMYLTFESMYTGYKASDGGLIAHYLIAAIEKQGYLKADTGHNPTRYVYTTPEEKEKEQALRDQQRSMNKTARFMRWRARLDPIYQRNPFDSQAVTEALEDIAKECMGLSSLED
jgi:hypothetical protein